jgi:mannose-6-phosphate isomerase-like protein (cupin superfamily)
MTAEAVIRSQATIHAGVIGRAGFGGGQWEVFSTDPSYLQHMHGEHKTQFWGEDYEKGPWVLAMRWEPGAYADAHVHDYDTIYVVVSGSFTFHDGTGWYQAGDVRWCRAGTTYGPEEAGPEGCDLLNVAMGPMRTEFVGGDGLTVASAP